MTINIPLITASGGALFSDGESATVFVELVVSVIDSNGRPAITTLSASLPVMTGGVNTWCYGYSSWATQVTTRMLFHRDRGSCGRLPPACCHYPRRISEPHLTSSYSQPERPASRLAPEACIRRKPHKPARARMMRLLKRAPALVRTIKQCI